MVPASARSWTMPTYSPRIRGDGPLLTPPASRKVGFSPYSRGWSRSSLREVSLPAILPVFAGMVPYPPPKPDLPPDSPRIRGDGPLILMSGIASRGFSPYSRGWSRNRPRMPELARILPVFAGMVPLGKSGSPLTPYSPRIRGDGPFAPALTASAP